MCWEVVRWGARGAAPWTAAGGEVGFSTGQRPSRRQGLGPRRTRRSYDKHSAAAAAPQQLPIGSHAPSPVGGGAEPGHPPHRLESGRKGGWHHRKHRMGREVHGGGPPFPGLIAPLSWRTNITPKQCCGAHGGCARASSPSASPMPSLFVRPSSEPAGPSLPVRSARVCTCVHAAYSIRRRCRTF